MMIFLLIVAALVACYFAYRVYMTLTYQRRNAARFATVPIPMNPGYFQGL